MAMVGRSGRRSQRHHRVPHCRSSLHGDQAIGVTGGVSGGLGGRRRGCGCGCSRRGAALRPGAAIPAHPPRSRAPTSAAATSARFLAFTGHSVPCGPAPTPSPTRRTVLRRGQRRPPGRSQRLRHRPARRVGTRAEYARRRARDLARGHAVFGVLAPLAHRPGRPEDVHRGLGPGRRGREERGRPVSRASGRRLGARAARPVGAAPPDQPRPRCGGALGRLGRRHQALPRATPASEGRRVALARAPPSTSAGATRAGSSRRPSATGPRRAGPRGDGSGRARAVLHRGGPTSSPARSPATASWSPGPRPWARRWRHPGRSIPVTAPPSPAAWRGPSRPMPADPRSLRRAGRLARLEKPPHDRDIGDGLGPGEARPVPAMRR